MNDRDWHLAVLLALQDVVVETADATRWEIPDDMTYAFFFVPFTGETARIVARKVVASLDRAPRRVPVIYMAPGREQPDDLEDELERSRRFSLERTEQGKPYGGFVATVYASREDGGVVEPS